jgi:predicted Zn-dependent protease
MGHGGRLLVAWVVLVAGLALGMQRVEASSTLDLLGVAWGKSEVTVQIKAAGGVTSQAVLDVEEAISDWNAVLAHVKGAPQLVLVSGVKRADITIQMKVGGGFVLGSALPKTSTPFTCELDIASIQLSGKAFGLALSSAGTRNIARHEIGHALGLGHSDNPNDLMHGSFESPEFVGDVDVPISQCDKDGLEAVYPLPTACSSIPDAVSCR